MLIIKLTRTQLLQQERKLKEERQSLKKLAKKSESANSANNKKTAAKMTLKKVPKKISTKKLSGGSLKPKAKPGMLRSTCGKNALNKKKANRSQTVPKIQSKERVSANLACQRRPTIMEQMQNCQWAPN